MSVDDITSAVNRRYNSDAGSQSGSSSSQKNLNGSRANDLDKDGPCQAKAEAEKAKPSDKVDEFGFSPSARRAFKMLWEDSSSEEDEDSKKKLAEGINMTSVS